ncbi:MAG: O-antigen ligase family protein [Deltaproteobacteria bacterium]|nr:O-antigen ligase family protein [Deltaproteobacteria bacterium]
MKREARTIPAVGKGGWNPYALIILTLTFSVPLMVVPGVLDNAFHTPKNLLILLGASSLVGLFAMRILLGRESPFFSSSTVMALLFLILLNVFSFFYTENYYYTSVAATLNVSCLLLFFFVSYYLDQRQALWLIGVVFLSGFLVSVETWLQFFNVFLLFKWAHPGINVMGTIGNSNYLGAYLVFPLFAALSLLFLTRQRRLLIGLSLAIPFIMAAFLFSRARAGWMGFLLTAPLFLFLVKKIHRFSVSGCIRSNPRRFIALMLGIVVFVFLLWSLAPKRLQVMLEFSNVTNSKTLVLRMQKYYQGSLWLFKQGPIFGTGLWSFRNGVYAAQAEINRIDPGYFRNYPEPKPRRVHNEYLEILNDGGLLAAFALLLFTITVMRHGWRVIRGETLETRDRVISATAFCSVLAVLLTAVFFFPFRINTTLFMTALMLGLMEGLYIRNFNTMRAPGGRGVPFSVLAVPIIVLVIVGMLWFAGIKPFMGEVEHFKYKKALANRNMDEAERHLLKAIRYDPHNTAYCMWASQLYMNSKKDFVKAEDFISRAIIDFNGDIVPWAAYYVKGLLRFQMGNPFGARHSFEKALYYNPTFQEAGQKLAEVNRVIKEHDQVLIKLR